MRGQGSRILREQWSRVLREYGSRVLQAQVSLDTDRVLFQEMINDNAFIIVHHLNRAIITSHFLRRISGENGNCQFAQEYIQKYSPARQSFITSF